MQRRATPSVWPSRPPASPGPGAPRRRTPGERCWCRCRCRCLPRQTCMGGPTSSAPRPAWRCTSFQHRAAQRSSHRALLLCRPCARSCVVRHGFRDPPTRFQPGSCTLTRSASVGIPQHALHPPAGGRLPAAAPPARLLPAGHCRRRLHVRLPLLLASANRTLPHAVCPPCCSDNSSDSFSLFLSKASLLVLAWKHS